MRTRSSRPQSKQTQDFEETSLAARKRQARSWLILGAGAVGVAGAIAKWAMQARQGTSAAPSVNALPHGVQTVDLTQQAEGTGTPVPLVTGMPQSAAPTNDARTALVEPELASEHIENQAANPLPPSDTSADTSKKARTSKTAKSTAATPDMIAPPAIATTATTATAATTNTAVSGSSRKRGKMSEEYDQALQANALSTDGREGERVNQRMEAETMSGNMSANTGKAQAGTTTVDAAAPAPASSSSEPAQQALSTQAEGKLAVGEELRDREFPVPPQKSGAASQKLVVDQETMHDGGPRQGGAIGTMPGDQQNVGTVGDIEDQAAKSPDFAQQR